MLSGTSLEKSFRGRGPHRQVLTGSSLEIPSGQLIGLTGLNGVGKSTLLRILAGVLQPDRGEVRLEGVDLTASPLERRRRVVLVQSESRGFYWRLTCRDNLRFFAVLQRPGASRDELNDAVEAELADLGLTDFADQLFMTLSSGYMQRMALARGLLHGGRFILLDEPSRELDVRARAHLLDIMEARVRDHGVGVVWVTHRPEELHGRAHGFLVLGPGAVVTQVGTAAAAEAALAVREEG